MPRGAEDTGRSQLFHAETTETSSDLVTIITAAQPEEDTLTLMNCTPFGLTAVIFNRVAEAAEALGDRTETGMISKRLPRWGGSS
ncbi:hypothetical protein [Acidocella sp.]|uniref:hypothetical protein n=1 Tax=Acidocella sp. TaxID=50710 RepID=UPI0026267336|nr:hypothetical protein [Acidocella sp.]